MLFKKYFAIVLLLLQSFFCISQQSFGLIDANATAETKALYFNLHKLSKQYILFGHQHATEYGHGWRGDENRSDVKSVTGSHPAVIGVDFSGLSGRPEEQIEEKKNIAEKYPGHLQSWRNNHCLLAFFKPCICGWILLE